MFWCDIVPGKLAHAAKGVDPDAMASNAQAALRKFAPKAVLDLAPPTETANGDHEKVCHLQDEDADGLGLFCLRNESALFVLF